MNFLLYDIQPLLWCLTKTIDVKIKFRGGVCVVRISGCQNDIRASLRSVSIKNISPLEFYNLDLKTFAEKFAASLDEPGRSQQLHDVLLKAYNF